MLNNRFRRFNCWAHIIFFLSITGLVTSCSDAALIDKNIPIENRSWDYANKPSIEVQVLDTSQRYDVYLNFRHTNQYAYSNVFVLLQQQYPGGLTDTTRVEIKLAESDGRWLGNGSGSIFSHQQLVKKHYSFPDTGRYIFTFEQNMRKNPLPAVADVGIRITPNTNP